MTCCVTPVNDLNVYFHFSGRFKWGWGSEASVTVRHLTLIGLSIFFQQVAFSRINRLISKHKFVVPMLSLRFLYSASTVAHHGQ